MILYCDFYKWKIYQCSVNWLIDERIGEAIKKSKIKTKYGKQWLERPWYILDAYACY